MVILMRIERWDVRRDGPLTDAALLHKLQALGYEPVRRAYPAGTMAAATIDNHARVPRARRAGSKSSAPVPPFASKPPAT